MELIREGRSSFLDQPSTRTDRIRSISFPPAPRSSGATAIEDAIALGVVFERGLKSDEIPARLKLYEKIRFKRANRIQQYTRIAGGDVKDKSVSLNSEYSITIYEFC